MGYVDSIISQDFLEVEGNTMVLRKVLLMNYQHCAKLFIQFQLS